MRINARTAEAVAWQAVGYVAGRRKEDRELLADGALYQVELAIVGQVARKQINLAKAVVGDLKVGHAAEVASSSAPDVNLVLGHLREMDPARFDRAILSMAEHLQTHGFVPPVDDEHYEAAKAALKSLRQQTTVTRRGSVRLAAA